MARTGHVRPFRPDVLWAHGQPGPLFISGYSAPAEVPGPFLAKPFAPEDLLTAVRLLIAGYDRLSAT